MPNAGGQTKHRTLASAPPTKLRARQVFLAFEGGGAAGLVHVGALKAFEEAARDVANPMAVGAYSGTSAGAMVAALAAAGYTADELIAPGDAGAQHRTILDTLLDSKGRPLGTAPNLFGRRGWWLITWASWAMRRRLLMLPVAMILLGATLFGVWLAVASLMGVASARLSADSDPVVPAAALIIALGIVAFALRSLVRAILGGLTTTDRVRAAYDQALRRKIAVPPNESVRFENLPREVDLKIVATNISNGRLELYSRATTPGVAIADAVAASICLPVIFSPKSINGKLHFDGGMVCNLPAWPFDEERQLDRDSVTIGFAVSGGPSHVTATPTRWIAPALRTAVFGSDLLNTRGAGRIEVIRLQTRIGVLDFDLSLAQVQQEVARQAAAARVRLDAQLLDRPRQLHLHSARVALLARAALRAFGPQRFRVAIALPEDAVRGGFLHPGEHQRVRCLTLRYGFGYRDQRDEGLAIPIEGTLIGEVFRSGQPQFCDLRGNRHLYGGRWNRRIGPASLEIHNRFRQRQVPQDLCWAYAVPAPIAGPELDDQQRALSLEGVVVITSRHHVPEANVKELLPLIRTVFPEQT